jgi:hypothetical protein
MTMLLIFHHSSPPKRSILSFLRLWDFVPSSSWSDVGGFHVGVVILLLHVQMNAAGFAMQNFDLSTER